MNVQTFNCLKTTLVKSSKLFKHFNVLLFLDFWSIMKSFIKSIQVMA